MFQRSKYLVRKLQARGESRQFFGHKRWRKKCAYCLMSGRWGVRNQRCNQIKDKLFLVGEPFKLCDLYCLLTIFSAQHRTSYPEGAE